MFFDILLVTVFVLMMIVIIGVSIFLMIAGTLRAIKCFKELWEELKDD